jgi:hypothetical protein
MLPDDAIQSPLDRALNAAATAFRETIEAELGEVPLALLFAGTAREAGPDENDGATVAAAANAEGYNLGALFAGLTQCATEAGVLAAQDGGAIVIRPSDN